MDTNKPQQPNEMSGLETATANAVRELVHMLNAAILTASRTRKLRVDVDVVELHEFGAAHTTPIINVQVYKAV